MHTHANTHLLFHTSKAVLKREEESKSNANAFCPSPHGMTLLGGVVGYRSLILAAELQLIIHRKIKKEKKSRIKDLTSYTGTMFYQERGGNRQLQPFTHTFLRAFSIQGIVCLCRNHFHEVSVFTGIKRIALLTTFLRKAVLFSYAQAV